MKTQRERAAHLTAFSSGASLGGKVVQYKENQNIYNQGAPALSVLYVRDGSAKLTVVNASGKGAVVAILAAGDFLGEACLAGHLTRMGTATAIIPTTVLVIAKDRMLPLLQTKHAFSNRFIAYMLARTVRVEENLIDQLFNSSEKRLARTLLLLARYGKEDQNRRIGPKISQETLAQMIGTTRSRVNFFMNRFRKLGFIRYNSGIHVNDSLLNVVLHE